MNRPASAVDLPRSSARRRELATPTAVGPVNSRRVVTATVGVAAVVAALMHSCGRSHCPQRWPSLRGCWSSRSSPHRSSGSSTASSTTRRVDRPARADLHGPHRAPLRLLPDVALHHRRPGAPACDPEDAHPMPHASGAGNAGVRLAHFCWYMAIGAVVVWRRLAATPATARSWSGLVVALSDRVQPVHRRARHHPPARKPPDRRGPTVVRVPRPPPLHPPRRARRQPQLPAAPGRSAVRHAAHRADRRGARPARLAPGTPRPGPSARASGPGPRSADRPSRTATEPAGQMRVGLVCPYSLSAPGGVQNQVTGLARARGRSVTTSRSSPPARCPTIEGTSVGTGRSLPRERFAGADGAAATAAGLRAVRALRRGRFDVLHLHEPLAPSITRAGAARPPGAGGWHIPRRGGTHAVPVAAAPRCVAWPTASMLAWPSPRPPSNSPPGISAAPTSRLFNGIDVGRFRDAPRPAVHRPAGPTMLFLGRHEPRKGLDVLLEACSSSARGHDAVDRRRRPRHRTTPATSSATTADPVAGPAFGGRQDLPAAGRLGAVRAVVGTANPSAWCCSRRWRRVRQRWPATCPATGP